jgi:hypothetical protein
MLAPCTSSAGLPPWWAEHIVVPAVFVLIGAIVAFAAGQFTTLFDANRQTHNFLKGIAAELEGLKADLRQKKTTADQACAEYADPNKTPEVVHFTDALGMRFFDTQLSKLPRISDERIFETISLYNDIAAVQRHCDRLTSVSYVLVHEGAGAASPKAENYFAGLKHLSDMIGKVSAGLDAVVHRIQ